MKRYLYILLAAITVVACQKDDTTDGGLQYPEGSVQFTTDMAQSRASQTTTMNAEGEQFQVAAYAKSSSSDYSRYFTTSVEYSNSAWGYEDTQFWPESGEVTFHAYSVGKSDWWLIENYLADNFADEADMAKHTITYTTNTGVYHQGDLLVANVTAQKSAQTEIEFSHALSGVGFTLQFADETNIYLNSLGIEYGGGKFVREGSYNFSDGEWTLSDTYFTDDDNTTEIPYYGSMQATSFTFSDNIFFLPQAITAESYIKVTVDYDILNEDKNNTSDTSTTNRIPVSVSATLPSLDNSGEYEMGYIYTYDLVVNNGEISVGEISVAEEVTTDATYGNIYLEEITSRTLYTSLFSSESEEEVTSYVTDFYSNNTGITVPDEATITSDVAELCDVKYGQYYLTTALRARNLIESGVRDFVIVGDYGAKDDGNAEFAKFGYWGGLGSPFNIAIWTLDPTYFGMEEYLFSVDMRNVTGLPTFESTHDLDLLEDATIVNNLNYTDPVMPAGIFYYVYNLREITLPSEVLAIDKDAFAGCNMLEDIDIQNVIHLESGALFECAALQHIHNGALTRVHDYAVQSCKKLESIDLSLCEEIDSYGFSGCTLLNGVNLTNLRSVGKHAFSDCSKLTFSDEYINPAKLEGVVGENAFEECNLLEGAIDLTATTEIGSSAFIDCYKLSVTFTGSSKITSVGSNSFKSCYEVEDFRMPEVTSVGAMAFYECSKLTFSQDNEMNTLSTISSNAFQGCSSIGQISINKLSSIGTYAFYGCKSLKISGNVGDGTTTYNGANITSIGKFTFGDCSSLDNYFIFDNVVGTVGSYAFSGCTNIKGLSMDNITSYEQYFVSDCNSLESVSFESVAQNSVEWESTSGDVTVTKSISIPEMLQGSRGTLKSVNLPLITQIADGGFSDFTLLSDIDVESVVTIGDSGFSGCTSLTSINLPNATTLGSNTFSDCSFTELYLPEVTTAGSSFISGVGSNLSSLIMPKLESAASVLSQSGIYSGTIPDSDWIPYNDNIITLDLSGATNDLGSCALAYFTELKSANLSSVKSIAWQTFVGCSNLEELYLSSVESISTYSAPFSGCTSLVKLDLQSFEQFYSTDDDGNITTYDPSTNNYSVFADIPHDCVIRLSTTQYAAADLVTLTWAGRTWGGILSPDEDFNP